MICVQTFYSSRCLLLPNAPDCPAIPLNIIDLHVPAFLLPFSDLTSTSLVVPQRGRINIFLCLFCGVGCALLQPV